LKWLFAPVGDETDERSVAFTPLQLSMAEYQPEINWYTVIEAG
jgi:hypothetical protein